MKTVAGALIAEAVLDGKMSLDDSISQYQPKGYSNLGVDQTAITIQHLLTHTSGLLNMLPVEAIALKRQSKKLFNCTQ